MSLAFPRVWPLESCLYCRHQRPKPSSLLCRFAEQRQGCSLYCLNCLVNFPPNLEHDSSKKIMFSMSYTLFPWYLTEDVGTNRGAWQACGPTHRPHTGDSPVALSWASAWMAILLHSGEPTSPQRWHTGPYGLAGARLGYMPEVQRGQSGSCLLAPVLSNAK